LSGDGSIPGTPTAPQSPEAPATPGTTTDPVIQQLSQSDPTLAQVLTDAQTQVTAGNLSQQGFSQFENNVAQGVSTDGQTGLFPTDASLLAAATQGLSSPDQTAVNNVIQTDLQSPGENPVSTYSATDAPVPLAAQSTTDTPAPASTAAQQTGDTSAPASTAAQQTGDALTPTSVAALVNGGSTAPLQMATSTPTESGNQGLQQLAQADASLLQATTQFDTQLENQLAQIIPLLSGDGSTPPGAPATPGTTTDPIIQQLSQTDPTLAKVLTDAQTQVTAGNLSQQGFTQFEQNVAQNVANDGQTGLFPTDASLLAGSTQGLSSADLAAVNQVIQTDLQSPGADPVSTYVAPTEAPTPTPQPPVDNPVPTPTPQPPVDNPVPTPTPQPPVDNPTPTPTPQPPVDNPTPTPTPTPQPPVDNPTPTPTPTPQPPVDNPTPAPTSTTPGPNSAIGPTGEVVGSTATTFGSAAMPEVSQTANAYYVSADGTANGTGTAANPFSTLQQAQKAMEGSSIKTTYVEGGTYNMSSGLNVTAADNGESFIGVGGTSNPVVLNGEGTSGSIATISGVSNFTMEGLTFQNTQKNLFAYSSDDAAVTATNSSGLNLSYNNVSDVGVAYNLGNVTNSQLNGNAIDNVQQAIQMNPGNNNDTVNNNSITNVDNITGGNQAGAINVEASSNDTFNNNYIANTQGGGISLANWGGVGNYNDTISGNTVENTNQGATKSNTYDSSGTNPSDDGAIYIWQGVQNNGQQMNLMVSNNYVKNSGPGFEDVGIYFDDGVSDAKMLNNIVVPNGNNGYAALIHGGSNDTIQGNVFDLSSSSGDQHGLLMQSDGPTMSGDVVGATNATGGNNANEGNYFWSSTNNGGGYVDYSNPSNDIPQTISGNTYWNVNAGTYDSNPINANPGFADPADGNYSTTADSAAQGSG
jgi:outer membrane biosynthesis protein TonB